MALCWAGAGLEVVRSAVLAETAVEKQGGRGAGGGGQGWFPELPLPDGRTRARPRPPAPVRLALRAAGRQRARRSAPRASAPGAGVAGTLHDVFLSRRTCPLSVFSAGLQIHSRLQKPIDVLGRPLCLKSLEVTQSLHGEGAPRPLSPPTPSDCHLGTVAAG